jgi:4-hydroxysphinganine ceramide fatty acyl 2-hydroxylase
MSTTDKPNYMFSRPFFDFFFRWRWWVAPMAFMPIVIILIILGFIYTNMSIFVLLISYFLGIFVWTLFEYFMHRYMFHVYSDVPGLSHMHYVIHGMHHVYPTDPYRVIFPPFLSLLVGGLIALVGLLFLPSSCFFPGMAGFVTGYCWYEFVHYANHQIKWKNPWLKKLKRHHLLHHHNEIYKDKNYGVTTVLWDHVFRTYLA